MDPASKPVGAPVASLVCTFHCWAISSASQCSKSMSRLPSMMGQISVWRWPAEPFLCLAACIRHLAITLVPSKPSCIMG